MNAEDKGLKTGPIYVALPLEADERKIMEETLFPANNIYYALDIAENNRFDAFLQSEVAFGNLPADWITKSNNLLWLQLNSAGINPYHTLNWDGHLSKVQVTNLRGFYGIPVAETALGGILAFYRKLHTLTQLQAAKAWQGPVVRPQLELLHGKRVLILGAGAIGQTIRKLLTAFSCSITMISRSSAPRLEDIETFLPEIDILINALPETAQTVGVLDEKRLKMMKQDALFVNVGRGSVVDEGALVKALQQLQIAGAVLDVTQTEPLPGESPLWELPNVILSQHSSGGYKEENINRVKVFLDNFNRYRTGKPLLNLVDFKKGY